MKTSRGRVPVVSRALIGAAAVFCAIVALPDLSPGLAETDRARGTREGWSRWERRANEIRRCDLAPEVLPFLRHSNARVRREAAELLARLDDPRMVDVLRQAYLEGHLERTTYAFAMENVRTPQGLPYLEKQVLIPGDESLQGLLEKQIERLRLSRERWGSRPGLRALVELHTDALAPLRSTAGLDGETSP